MSLYLSAQELQLVNGLTVILINVLNNVDDDHHHLKSFHECFITIV